MSPSYQTIPPANAPKDEPSSTLVPMMKKVAVAAMVGTALVVGYSYGASTNPTVTDLATTAAANLVRGGAEMKKEDCITGPCNKNKNEKACLSGTFTKGCNWYPHWLDGECSSCSGVSCGNHRAVACNMCNFYGPSSWNPLKTKNKGENYCNGDCKWETNCSPFVPGCMWPKCYPK